MSATQENRDTDEMYKNMLYRIFADGKPTSIVIEADSQQEALEEFFFDARDEYPDTPGCVFDAIPWNETVEQAWIELQAAAEGWSKALNLPGFITPQTLDNPLR